MAEFDCIARVAAHATRTSVEAFKVFAAVYQPAPQRKPPFSERLFYAYLLHHGYLCGLRLNRPQMRGCIIPRDAYDVRESDAFVCVETGNPRWLHALYWDASRGTLLDCKAEGVTPVPIGEFPIKCWVPIAKLAP